jgi:hypothetical protein
MLFQGSDFTEATMIETAISVNGQDCTKGAGNTPEEYEAMAATLLRVAQAVREHDNGKIRCLTPDGRVLLSVIVLNRDLVCNGSEREFPPIEELHCVQESTDRAVAFRNMSRSMIDHFRQLNVDRQ